MQRTTTLTMKRSTTTTQDHETDDKIMIRNKLTSIKHPTAPETEVEQIRTTETDPFAGKTKNGLRETNSIHKIRPIRT
jgi:hypothetical protein